MEFSVIKEKRVIPAGTTPEQEYTIAKLRGPCLACEREIEYASNWPSDERHARKQFESKRRKALLGRLGEEDVTWKSRHTSPMVTTIEGMVCPECQVEYRERRKVATRQVQAESQAQGQREEEERIARVLHYEWHTATVEEARSVPPGITEFRAVFSNFELHEVVFRWRAVPGKCRGQSYLMRVGMWVDGRLTAHYYAWNLQRLEDHSISDFYCSEDGWPTSDLFGLGFSYWIERAFQSRLLRVPPDKVWRPGKHAEGKLDIEEIGSRPAALHVEWIDGTCYVHVLPSLNLPNVAAWAEMRLGLHIEERIFRPVRGTKASNEQST